MNMTEGGFSKINLKLFTINNQPLKFNLDGCDADKFNGIIKTIETFGGELADPRNVDTVIFSDRNLQFTLPCDRFDSQFIYDSIVAQKLQNLENYRIVPIDKELKSSAIKRRREKISTGEEESGTDGKSSRNVTTEILEEDRGMDCGENNAIQLDNPVENPKRGDANGGELSENCGTSPSEHQSSDEHSDSPVNGISRRKQQRKQKRTTRIVSSLDEKPTSLVAQRLPKHPYTKRNDNANSNNSTNINNAANHEGDIAPLSRFELYHRMTGKRPASFHDLQNPPAAIAKVLKSLLKNCSIYMGQDHIGSSTSTTNTQECVDLKKADGAENAPRDLRYKFSKVSECSKNVPEKYQIASTSREPAKISAADYQSSEMPKTTEPFQNAYDNDDREGNSDDNDDDDGIADGDRDVSVNSGVSEPCDVSKESEFNWGTSKSTLKDSDSSYSPESSESEYDPNVTAHKTKRNERRSKKKSRHIFTEDENNRMIQYLIKKKAIRRAKGRSIWKKFLVDEVVNEPKPTVHALVRHFQTVLEKNYKKYTNDPIALRAFEYKIAPRQRYRIPWTEEEHQFMINYLITNQGILKARSTKIWEECLETSPFFQKSHRTPVALRNRFTQHLRYNYAKYTNDQNALLQFKDMEIKVPAQRA